MTILLEIIVEQPIWLVMRNINKNVKIFKFSFITQRVTIITLYFNIFMNLLIKTLNFKFYQKIVNNI